MIDIYLGTYTKGESRGIYRCRLDPAHGTLSRPELAAETQHPSYLLMHPALPVLYAVNELAPSIRHRTGYVSAFALDAPGGALSLAGQESSGGGRPCHLGIDPAGRFLFVANYDPGAIAVLPLDRHGVPGEAVCIRRHEGSSVHPRRQREPHPHSMHCDAAGRHVLVPDLGIDRVMVYRLDPATGTLDPQPGDTGDAAGGGVRLAAGAGPRSLAFGAGGRVVYIANELSSTVSVMAYDPQTGALGPEQQAIPTLPHGFRGASTAAEVQLHPSGRFLYVSNRGHDSIASFVVDRGSGLLTLLGHQPSGGSVPRHFAIDPTGRWLLAANQESHNLSLFSIHHLTGQLEAAGTAELPGSFPTCVLFAAASSRPSAPPAGAVHHA